MHAAAAMYTVAVSNSGATMTTRIRISSAVFAAALLLTTVTAPVFAEEQAQGSASGEKAPKKHSKLKGAVGDNPATTVHLRTSNGNIEVRPEK